MLLLLATAIAAAQQPLPAPQNPNPASSPASNQAANPAPGQPAKDTHPPTSAQARRAAKLFLSASRLYQNGQFEPALSQYQQAAALDPSNQDYAGAVELARSHAVTALIQSAAKARAQNNLIAARAALARALQIDPKNSSVAEHLSQLADDALAENAPEHAMQPSYTLAGPIDLEPAVGTQSFHLRIAAQQLVRQVYKAYGIDATIDTSVPITTVRFDLDDATFSEAARALALTTGSFAVPIDPHRVIVARDTQQYRTQYQRNAFESVSLVGLSKEGSQNEMSDIQAVAKNIFDIQRMSLDTGASALILQAPASTLNAFNSTWSGLPEGRPEVVIDVRVVQLAHTKGLTTGVQTPQQLGVFNVLAEANSILQANQALVQQIISSGLAGPNDIATILAILLASGQVNSPLFNNGFAIFGGPCSLSSGTCSPTAFALVPGSTGFNVNVNSSDTRQLDSYQFRLMDGEEGTLKSGSRYPITTSTYSSPASSLTNIPGLNSAGNSGALSGILSSLNSVPTIPQIQYQDIGLTFKATPHILRSGHVALNVDMKILSLQGGSVNGIPILANRAYTGAAILLPGEAAVVASEVDSTEVRAISGMPGLSEIPGLNNATDKSTQTSSATLLIVMTPRIVRLPNGMDPTPMRILDRTGQAR